MKKIIAILGAALLLTGCSSNPQNEFSQKDTNSKIFNVSTSYFESYTDEETDSAYIVKGRVDQENDGNAVAVRVHAKENKTIGLKGTLTKISGSDTELVYVSPDGEKEKITDNSSDSYNTTIHISEGDGKIIFMGEHAVYDFEIELEFAEGVTYSDL